MPKIRIFWFLLSIFLSFSTHAGDHDDFQDPEGARKFLVTTAGLCVLGGAAYHYQNNTMKIPPTLLKGSAILGGLIAADQLFDIDIVGKIPGFISSFRKYVYPTAAESSATLRYASPLYVARVLFGLSMANILWSMSKRYPQGKMAKTIKGLAQILGADAVFAALAYSASTIVDMKNLDSEESEDQFMTLFFAWAVLKYA